MVSEARDFLAFVRAIFVLIRYILMANPATGNWKSTTFKLLPFTRLWCGIGHAPAT